MNILTKQLIILVVLTFIAGCTTGKNTSKADKMSAEKVAPKQLPPLFKKGTKPLLVQNENDILPDPNHNIAPCYDPETSEEKRFKLADLKSELVPLSYSSTDRVVASLQVMGIKTIVAAAPVAAPYTVDARGQVSYLPKPTTAPIAESEKNYSCSELPIFYKLKSPTESNLTSMMKGPAPAYGSGSKFSFIDLASADYGLNENLVAFYHPEEMQRFENIKTDRKSVV